MISFLVFLSDLSCFHTVNDLDSLLSPLCIRTEQTFMQKIGANSAFGSVAGSSNGGKTRSLSSNGGFSFLFLVSFFE